MRSLSVSACVSAILVAAAQGYAVAAIADDEVQEVIVTATRRAQSVTDIPYNISAVGSADLQSSGVTDLQSLTHMVPGLVSPDLGARAGSSNSNLIIRGLNASSANTQDQNIVAPLVSTEGAWHARLDASYRSDFWTALQHSTITQDLPGFLLLNTRLGYDAGALRVEAFVENLTNRMAATTISPVPGPDHERALYVSRPRTVGIDLHYFFRKN